MYVTYLEDGSIQSTISGPDETYGKILDANKQNWIFVVGAVSVDIRTLHVDPDTKTLKQNADMQLKADKPTFKADDKDVCTVSGIPQGARVQVYVGDHSYADEIVTDGTVEITSPVPATYLVRVSLVRYMPTSIEVTAQ